MPLLFLRFRTHNTRSEILPPERDPQESTGRRWVVAQLLGISGEQVDRIRPLFPKEPGVKRVEDRKVLSGITPVIQKGLRWVDAPAAYGPHKTLDNRCRRW